VAQGGVEDDALGVIFLVEERGDLAGYDPGALAAGRELLIGPTAHEHRAGVFQVWSVISDRANSHV